MASAERQCGEAHKEHATMIRRFLYGDKKTKVNIPHTDDEYRAFLDNLMSYCYDEYKDFALAYGWIEEK